MSAEATAAFRYAATDIAAEAALPRVLHGLAARSPRTFLTRAASIGAGVLLDEVRDRVAPLRPATLRVEPGRARPHGGARALYLHWSPDGRVSGMVLLQLALWRACGFDVVFVSNAVPPGADWDAAGADTVLRLARRNVGRDFGAWRDAAAIADERFGTPGALLLANDSVLGPILPLAPLVAAWRADGPGLFGMTESWGGGPHLQSYALLAQEPDAVAATRAHLAGLRDRRSKWRLVQAGEIGLSRRFAAAGLRRAALFPYPAACAAIDPATRAQLGPRFAAADAPLRYPLNPTHHLWRVLVERLGFPFLKTELILRNPGRLPDVAEWRALVPPATLPLIEAHLRTLGRP